MLPDRSEHYARHVREPFGFEKAEEAMTNVHIVENQTKAGRKLLETYVHQQRQSGTSDMKDLQSWIEFIRGAPAVDMNVPNNTILHLIFASNDEYACDMLGIEESQMVQFGFAGTNEEEGRQLSIIWNHAMREESTKILTPA